MPQAPKGFVAPWAPRRDPEEKRREEDERRNRRHAWRKWYKTSAWRSIRARRKAVEPLCRMCQDAGVVRAAEIVDHIVPHKGDRALFFCFENTQSLCAAHHNRDKQRAERAGDIGAAPEFGPDDRLPI